MNALVDRGKALWGRWQASRPGRTLERYNSRNGSLLCGGTAYAALFSLFAALTIGWTVFMAVLGGDAALRTAVLKQIDLWVPGLVDTGEGGVVRLSELRMSGGVSVASVVATGVLLFFATAFMAALRTSVRAMYDLSDDEANLVLAQLSRLVGFVILAAAVLLAAGASVVASAVVPRLADLLGGGPAVGFLLRGLSLLVGVLLDAVVVAAIIRFVGGVHLPRRELLTAALSVAVVAGGLRYLGTSVVVGTAGRNALLASFAVVVTLLVLVNFLGRVLLLACAWTAEAGGGREAGDDAPGEGEPDGDETDPQTPEARPGTGQASAEDVRA